MKIVIKIGSQLIINKDKIFEYSMDLLLQEINYLVDNNNQVIIVTSGAVAWGRGSLDLLTDNTLSINAYASVGQAKLNCFYDKFLHSTIGQVLVTPDCFKNREQYESLKNTLNELVEASVIPIVNENDVTVVNGFGDNDGLAAMIAVMVHADRLLFLTNQDGLYSSDPNENKNAELIKEVVDIDLEIQKMCSKKTSSVGRGGMMSKLRAAKLATNCGVESFIVNGFKVSNILNPQGTRFIAKHNGLSERKRWLMIGTISQGKIVVDQGAREAMESNRSLLAVGVRKIYGQFKERDFVEIADMNGEIFAFGLINYDSDKLISLETLNKDKIKNQYAKEIVHVNDLTLLR